MMKYAVRCSIAVAALVFSAASASSRTSAPPAAPAPQASAAPSGCGNGEICSGWKSTIQSNQPMAGAFSQLARKYGCRTYNEESFKVAAECREGSIVFIQEGYDVLIGCTVDEPNCRQLFANIANVQ